MCRPKIASDGYDGLMLVCKEHNTGTPVLNKEGLQAYDIDVLHYVDMLIAHRKEHEQKEKEDESEE